ncbi:glycosyltransferase family 2 protein [Flavobacterium subsaxonicum]|uniref:Glycosyl transferase family 2 n=1 Tax=Flavobacterium subsaxonicum WB 4.1-42 = DSM 21790 TaxID=1121898 RepID=A0A0A2MXG3_9FLAO|nr:glycosyltransferase family 2 protein [Flavobacterium subsaxonicum]KGO92915.1 glycosyl transferase family 2 [Flavobacterium subsaxonicum WB 4.1-42 = DSM 21790]
MQLSIIILNYNVRYFLELCVLSVQQAIKGIDAEIIVVDNNSPDNSCAMMKERFPEITLIENNENSGFPKGNNIGVATAKGKYICILNPDTVVAEDTFSKILAFAESQKDFGIAGAKLVDGRGHFLPESKRGVPTPWVAFTKIGSLYKLLPKQQIFNRYYAQHLQENQTGKVDILVGCFMVMRRELYLEVGGFDEDCFMYSDDIDLSYTILKKGLRNYYFADTAIIHYKGESTVKDGTYMKRFREAMQFFYQKHFRRSPQFDLLMRVGTLFFAMAKKNKKSHQYIPQHYILISEDEFLRQSLQGQLNKNVILTDLVAQEALFLRNNKTEIIFDNDFVSFSQMIAFMEKYRDLNFTYKIKPAGSAFIIGSNSSSDRGDVLLLQGIDVKSVKNY